LPVSVGAVASGLAAGSGDAIGSGAGAVASVEAGGVAEGSVVGAGVVGAGVVIGGVVCGVVGAGVVWANATPETPTIRAPASVTNFIQSLLFEVNRRPKTDAKKGSRRQSRCVAESSRFTGDQA
jgi:hypothetical protein